MKKSYLTLAVVLAIVSGCTLDEVVEHGKSCSWGYVLTENGIICQSKDGCKSEFIKLKQDGICPFKYDACTYDPVKELNFCYSPCPEDFIIINNKCVENSEKYIKKQTDAGVTYWISCPDECKSGCKEDGTCKPVETDTPDCQADGSCQCPDSCKAGCNDDGSCNCPDSCKAGCNDDGSCNCPDSCKAGCNDDGSCNCPDSCKAECNDDGSCNCPDSCKAGCNDDGSCNCPDSCKAGCNDDGSCNCPDSCTNGCDTDGSCKCPGCLNGCDENLVCLCSEACSSDCLEDGSCQCPDDCLNGCDKDGLCLCLDNCKAGCDETGACTCPEICPNHCTNNGECLPDEFMISAEHSLVSLFVDDDNTSINIDYLINNEISNINASLNVAIDNEDCVSVKLVGDKTDTLSISINRESDTVCKAELIISDNTDKASDLKLQVQVVPQDANGNHLHDRYETAQNQGNTCSKHSDCDTEEGKGDGFCDSLIGFKCSSKCSSNDECVKDGKEYAEGKPFDYICRSDGRCSPKQFVTVWEIDPDRLTNNKFVLPVSSLTATIDWGDGIKTPGATLPEHFYSQKGTYTIAISGEIKDWSFKEKGMPYSLKEVKSFGPVSLGSHAFYAIGNIPITTDDIPNPKTLSTLASAFMSSKYNGTALNLWDTSNVKDMNAAFALAANFNQPLDKWDTSNVTDMHDMFLRAAYFDQNLDSWNTGKVTDMSQMFMSANSFNGKIDSWNTSNVINMKSMFQDASMFNQNLDKWNTQNVSDMTYMFSSAVSFNGNVGTWNTSNVQKMVSMFANASKFNQDLDKWNTENVINMSGMFYRATSFNGKIGTWATSKVESFNGMFSEATVFNQDLDKWETPNVEDMSYMFREASSFNGKIGTWNTSKVTNMTTMFQSASSFNQPLNDWNTENVQDMSSMFESASSFNQDLDKWNTKNVTNMENMFLEASAFNGKLGTWNTSKVTDMSAMFKRATAFDQDISQWNYSALQTQDNGTGSSYRNCITMLQDTALYQCANGNCQQRTEQNMSKPASSTDNFCKIYKKISNTFNDVSINLLLYGPTTCKFCPNIKTICN